MSSNTDEKRGTPFTDVTNRHSCSPTAVIPEGDSSCTMQDSISLCSSQRISLTPLRTSKTAIQRTPTSIRTRIDRHPSPSYYSMSPVRDRSGSTQSQHCPKRTREERNDADLSPTLPAMADVPDSIIEDPFLCVSVMPRISPLLSKRRKAMYTKFKEMETDLSPTRRSGTLDPLSAPVASHPQQQDRDSDMSPSRHSDDECVMSLLNSMSECLKTDLEWVNDAYQGEMQFKKAIMDAEMENRNVREWNLDLLDVPPSFSLEL